VSFEFQDFETVVEIPGEGRSSSSVTGDDGAHR